MDGVGGVPLVCWSSGSEGELGSGEQRDGAGLTAQPMFLGGTAACLLSEVEATDGPVRGGHGLSQDRPGWSGEWTAGGGQKSQVVQSMVQARYLRNR